MSRTSPPAPVSLAALCEAAAGMHEVNPEALRREAGLDARWWQARGPVACDLFQWHHAETGLVRFQLVFEDRLVEWSAEAGVATGRLATWKPSEEHDRSRIVFDNEPDSDALAAARELIRHVPVDELARRRLLKALESV